MPRGVRVDRTIVDFIRKTSGSRGGPRRHISVFATEAIREFLDKDPKCEGCSKHKTQLADLEIKRQAMARRRADNGKAPGRDDDRVFVQDSVHERLLRLADAYRRPVKIVAEQAILEALTWPDCKQCPMRKNDNE